MDIPTMDTTTMLFIFAAVVALAIIIYCVMDRYGKGDKGGEGQKELRIYAQEPWFSEIRAGRKIVEARVGGPDFYMKHIGSPAIVMVPGGESHPTHIAAVRHYPDLDTFLEKEDVKKYAPHLKTKGEAKAAYLATKDRSGTSIFGADRIAEKGGVTAIELGAPKK
jgi:ASC-1-like (ASCH) protein